MLFRSGQGLYPRIWKNSSEYIFVQYRPNGVTTSITSASTVSLNTKYHIVFTYNAATGGILYINGVFSSNNTSTIGTHDGGTSGNMNIGYDSNLSVWSTSRINVLRMYDKVLSASEVLQNYKAQKSKFDNTLIQQGLVLNLDAGNPYSYAQAGSTWYDTSGAINDFTIVNAPTYSSGEFVLNGSTQ